MEKPDQIVRWASDVNEDQYERDKVGHLDKKEKKFWPTDLFGK